MNEHIWEKARKNQVFRERGRLIRLGRIKPYDAAPIVMVKNSETGAWSLPSLKAA